MEKPFMKNKFDICIVASRCKKNVYWVTVGDLALSSLCYTHREIVLVMI